MITITATIAKIAKLTNETKESATYWLSANARHEWEYRSARTLTKERMANQMKEGFNGNNDRATSYAAHG